MPRHPLLPLLRIGALLTLGALLLWPRRTATPPMAPDVVWATDVGGPQGQMLRIGQRVTGPLAGQKRPPCAKGREREIAGGCWIRTEHTPPCPEGIYEAFGMCVMPVEAAQRPATSIDD